MEVNNPFELGKTLRCDALVNTGASHLVLPKAWKDRLGTVPVSSRVDMETPDQKSIGGEVCGPFTIQLEGFRPVSGEVLFIDMQPNTELTSRWSVISTWKPCPPLWTCSATVSCR